MEYRGGIYGVEYQYSSMEIRTRIGTRLERRDLNRPNDPV